VQVDLAEDLVGEQAALFVEHGDRTFVTGGLDCEHSHWTVTGQAFKIPHPISTAPQSAFKTKT
jgi:mannitol/fructose-specific phosphotransferase system IIA component